jgi:hypothetical protein
MARGVTAAAATASRRPPRRVDGERDIEPLRVREGAGRRVSTDGTEREVDLAVRRL